MTADDGRSDTANKAEPGRRWFGWTIEPERPALTILIAFALSLGGSLALAALIGALLPEAQAPDFSWYLGKGMFTVVVLALITPAIETLILAGIASTLLRWMRPVHAVLLSSLGWALAHSTSAPIWGLVIWWPFLIFATLYLVWKKRSLWWGLFIPFAIHALQNLPMAVAIGYPGLLPFG